MRDGGDGVLLPTGGGGAALLPDLAALSAARRHMLQQLEGVGALQALVLAARAQQQQQRRRRLQQAQQQQQQLDKGSEGERSRVDGLCHQQSSADSIGGAIGDSGGDGLLAVANLPSAAGGGDFGATPLLHFVYKHIAKQALVESPLCQPLVEAGLQKVRVTNPSDVCLAGSPLLARQSMHVVCCHSVTSPPHSRLLPAAPDPGGRLLAAAGRDVRGQQRPQRRRPPAAPSLRVPAADCAAGFGYAARHGAMGMLDEGREASPVLLPAITDVSLQVLLPCAVLIAPHPTPPHPPTMRRSDPRARALHGAGPVD